MAKVARLDVVPPGHDGARFKRVLDQAGDTLRSVDGAARVVVGLFEINRRVRPQAEATRPATVVEDALALVQLFERSADMLLFRGLNTGESGDDRFLGRKQVAIVEQVED